MTPLIILRDCIAATDETMPKGLIMPWPSDMKLPPGMIWLREIVWTDLHGDGSASMGYGDFTPEAKKIMEEMIS